MLSPRIRATGSGADVVSADDERLGQPFRARLDGVGDVDAEL